jgi:hypothetical protein
VGNFERKMKMVVEAPPKGSGPDPRDAGKNQGNKSDASGIVCMPQVLARSVNTGGVDVDYYPCIKERCSLWLSNYTSCGFKRFLEKSY